LSRSDELLPDELLVLKRDYTRWKRRKRRKKGKRNRGRTSQK
jgi:hypothetical protein